MEDVGNNEFSVSILDLPELNRMQKLLTELQDNTPQDFLDKIDGDARTELQGTEIIVNCNCCFLITLCCTRTAIAENPPPGIFLPTKDKAIRDLSGFPFSTLAKNRFQVGCEKHHMRDVDDLHCA